MEDENSNKESNEVIKARGTCKQFIKLQGKKLEQCSHVDSDGSLVYELNYKFTDTEEIPVKFSVIPAKSKEVHDKMLVWSNVVSIEDVPAQNRQEFYKSILKLNYDADTAWCGISKDGKVTVKSERMIKGIDLDELVDMLKMTVKLAQEIKSNICVVYGVKILSKGNSSDFSASCSVKIQKAEYSELLGKLQRKVMETLDACKAFLQSGNYAQCCKIYFKNAYELLDCIKKYSRVESSGVVAAIKEDLERAIADIPYFTDNRKKYEMIREVFQNILKAR